MSFAEQETDLSHGGKAMTDAGSVWSLDHLPVLSENEDNLPSDLTDPTNESQLVLFSFLAGVEQLALIFV